MFGLFLCWLWWWCLWLAGEGSLSGRKVPGCCSGIGVVGVGAWSSWSLMGKVRVWVWSSWSLLEGVGWAWLVVLLPR